MKCFNHKKWIRRNDFTNVIGNTLVFEKLEVVGHELGWLDPTTSDQCRQNPAHMHVGDMA